MNIFLRVLLLTILPMYSWASSPSFSACKSLAEQTAIKAIGHSSDIMQAKATLSSDQSQFDLEKNQVMVRIFVDEDQAGFYIFSAKLRYFESHKSSGPLFSCELTELVRRT